MTSRSPSTFARRLADVLVVHPWIVTATLCALASALSLHGPDSPAQSYRTWLFRHGALLWNDQWYGGHLLPGYSTLFPPLAAAIGAQTVGALACIASTVATTRLVRPNGGREHGVALLWFSAVTVGDLVVGRLPYALGLAFGLGAILAVSRRRPALAGIAAMLCSLASPLAAAFLLLAGTAWAASIGIRRTLPLAAASTGLVVSVALGGGGIFPFPVLTLLGLLVFVVVGLYLTPRTNRVLRRGLLLYGAAALVLFAVPNPVGGNVARIASVSAGPLAALVLLQLGKRRLLALLVIPILAWQAAPVAGALASAEDDLSTNARYYAGLMKYLKEQGQPQGRLEIPFTRSHWETSFVAKSYPLARGWERQLDVAFNAPLYDPALTDAGFHRWLLDTGVDLVALPDVALDPSAQREAEILSQPQPWLTPVWSDRHWQVWRVVDSPGIVLGDAHLDDLGIDSFTVTMRSAGSAVVLVRYSRFWQVAQGQACLAPTPDGWTSLTTTQPGQVVAEAKLSLTGLAGGDRNQGCAADSPPAPNSHDRFSRATY